MQRRGKRYGLKRRLPSPRFDKCHAVEPLNFVLDPDSSIEIDEIGAELEEHVLAVVYHFARAWVFVGTGAATEIGTALENSHLESALGECASGGQASQTAADYRDVGFFFPTL